MHRFERGWKTGDGLEKVLLEHCYLTARAKHS